MGDTELIPIKMLAQQLQGVIDDIKNEGYGVAVENKHGTQILVVYRWIPGQGMEEEEVRV